MIMTRVKKREGDKYLFYYQRLTKGAGDLTGTGSDGESCSSRQDPSQPLNLAFPITVQGNGDFVIQLLDRRVDTALHFLYCHLVVVEHPLQVVVQPRQLLVHALRENIHFVL